MGKGVSSAAAHGEETNTILEAKGYQRKGKGQVTKKKTEKGDGSSTNPIQSKGSDKASISAITLENIQATDGTTTPEENKDESIGNTQSTCGPAQENVAQCSGGPDKECGKAVGDDDICIQCDSCAKWCHAMCQGLEVKAMQAINQFNLLWVCSSCSLHIKRQTLPVVLPHCLSGNVDDTGKQMTTFITACKQ